jgi:hypothetical protein
MMKKAKKKNQIGDHSKKQTRDHASQQRTMIETIMAYVTTPFS